MQFPLEEREPAFTGKGRSFPAKSSSHSDTHAAPRPEDVLALIKLHSRSDHQIVYTWNMRERALTWGDAAGASIPYLRLDSPFNEAKWVALIHEEDRQIFLDMREHLQHPYDEREASQAIEYRLLSDGVCYDVRQTCVRCEAANNDVMVAGVLDVRPHGDTRAHSDSCSYYPSWFVNDLQRNINRCIAEGSQGALLMVAINNLPMIMNGYGSETSETVIAKLIERIREILAPHDTVARVQRDQIGIIVATCFREDIEMTAARINNIIQNFGRESYDTAALHVICAIAGVCIPSETAEALDALSKAFVSVNSAQPSYFRTFEGTRKEADLCRQQMGLANYLYRALKEKRIRLAWQPIIESTTGKVSHYEALLRMINNNGNITSAGALIPIAERMGLIDIIDTMVLEMVVKELRDAANVTLAFNVSNLTTENSLWLDTLTLLIKETPEIAPRLIVEITETAAHKDLRRAAYFVASLQSMGCQVALDDFGSGYTSFRQLKALSVDTVKIDGVFVKDLSSNMDNRFFVKTLLDFTKGFGLKAVAEFVENGETAKILLDMGVDYMQGYIFGKPENHRSWLNQGEYKKD
jgi:EAL domain-containing protein (putative c-di-GMP-specific phosphodiesterase class I)/GGDEF domain-containing protein